MNPNIKAKIENFEAWKATEAADKPIRELLTTTNASATAGLFQAAVLVNLGTGADLRDICMVNTVGANSGSKIEVPLLTSPTYQKWASSPAEGVATSPATETTAGLAVATCTLAPIGNQILISDLMAGTGAASWISQIGEALGGSVRKGIYETVLDAMVAASGINAVSCSSASGGSALTFVEVAAAIAANGSDGFTSDFITCSNASMWNAFTTSYAVTQFTGALNDLMVGGKMPNSMGLQWYPEPTFATVAAEKTVAVVGTKGKSAICAQTTAEPQVKMFYNLAALGTLVSSTLEFGAAAGFADSICKITSNT